LADTTEAASVIVYPGSVENAEELIQFFRREVPKLRHLKRVVISREGTVVLDVNRDGIEFPGLTYGSAVLEHLLRELGVVFTPQKLHDPTATPGGKKEYPLSARWTWGHDRVM
jgi:hypothetical protein